MGVFLYLLILFFAIYTVWLFPAVSIARSTKITGFKKFMWFIVTLFLSWPVYILYLTTM